MCLCNSVKKRSATLYLQFYYKMPISAEQWRASTGSINNFRAPRTLPASHPALNDLPSPPPSSWKGYSSLLVLLSVPLIYKIYFAVIMFFASGATHRLTIGTGSTCNTSTVGESALLLFWTSQQLLILTSYLTILIFCRLWIWKGNYQLWKYHIQTVTFSIKCHLLCYHGDISCVG